MKNTVSLVHQSTDMRNELATTPSDRTLITAITKLDQSQFPQKVAMIANLLRSASSSQQLVRIALDQDAKATVLKYYQMDVIGSAIFEPLIKALFKQLNSKFIYQPHPNLAPYEIFLALSLYKIASETNNEDTLHEAVMFHSTHALRDLSTKTITRIKHSPHPDQLKSEIDKVISLFEIEVALHGVPTLIDLSLFLLDVSPTLRHDSETSRSVELLTTKAIAALSAAREIEDNCQASINMAYNGFGLSYSNTHGYDKLATAIKDLNEFYAKTFPNRILQGTISRQTKEYVEQYSARTHVNETISVSPYA